MVWSFIETEAGHGSWPRIIIKASSNGGTTGMDLLFDRGLDYGIRFCIVDCDTIFSPVPTDTWVHVAVTYDGSDIVAYLDGEEVGTVPQRGAPLDTTGLDLHIGSGSAFDRPFDGKHDEVRIWDIALDAETVAWHMDTSSIEFLAVQPGGKSATTWAAVKSATR
ncbi:LamG domain-containing protein, partial [Candidatus Poribacteria bacterium]|nr:LamG domain-containing protein [Candidatus Poribacteria bacterium]